MGKHGVVKENKINRELVYSKCDGKCGYCGKELSFTSMNIDHIIPKGVFSHAVSFHYRKDYMVSFLTHLTINDVDNEDNLMPVCRNCNSRKSDLSIETYRERLFDYVIEDKKATWEFLFKNIPNLPIVDKNIPLFYFETLDSEFFKPKQLQRSVLDTAILYLKKKKSVELVRNEDNFKVWANEFVEYILEMNNFEIWSLTCNSIEIYNETIYKFILPSTNAGFKYLMLALDQENN